MTWKSLDEQMPPRGTDIILAVPENMATEFVTYYAHVGGDGKISIMFSLEEMTEYAPEHNAQWSADVVERATLWMPAPEPPKELLPKVAT